MVDLLLPGGTDPNAQAAGDYTVLHQAAAFGQTEVVDALVRGGVAPKLRTDKGLTALSFAMAKGHSDTAKPLQDTGAKV